MTPEKSNILRLDVPPAPSCVVADSPHSGCEYPDDFGFACDFSELRKAEDAGVDALCDFFPGLGVPFLQAQFPRAYIDPNRRDAVTEKFLRDGDGVFHPSRDALLREKCTPRSDQKIYDRKLKLSEVFNRVAGYYRPYHDRLAEVLDETRARHGKVVHLNCHSMPSTMLRGRAPNKYDIILGTRDGETCAPELVAKLRNLLETKGYKVGVNVPGYRGAEIVRRTGNPRDGRHSIQIEINRSLYMDEESVTPLPGMAKLRDDLKDAMAEFVTFCEGWRPAPSPRRKMPAP
ncbi:MAG: N-formylglutamate amidohydrolase [Alphaproteobacteria bacterium]|nr:MAG: N-formylglutamate amidohydrolase [Alphaproteobacteria bacterium]